EPAARNNAVHASARHGDRGVPRHQHASDPDPGAPCALSDPVCTDRAAYGCCDQGRGGARGIPHRLQPPRAGGGRRARKPDRLGRRAHCARLCSDALLIQPAAGILVWLGASLVVVGDGRRGLAAGIALSLLGLAVLAFVTAGAVAAAAIAAGGAIAATRRSLIGPGGWEILAPGSTPRLVLCVATALVAFWIADAVTTGPVASLRFGLIT